MPVRAIRLGGRVVDGRVVGGRLFVAKAGLARLLGEEGDGAGGGHGGERGR